VVYCIRFHQTKQIIFKMVCLACFFEQRWWNQHSGEALQLFTIILTYCKQLEVDCEIWEVGSACEEFVDNEGGIWVNVSRVFVPAQPGRPG